MLVRDSERIQVLKRFLFLQTYFEFVANIWLSFAPSELKNKFSRDFKFPVTVPHTFLGELPEEMRSGVRQLEIHVVA
jgi:hypothetical protein